MSGEPFKRWMCFVCGFLYDEALGCAEHGLPPGTRWADVPESWTCPDCGTPKYLYEMVEIPYAPGQPVSHQLA
jgi:rubredoxin